MNGVFLSTTIERINPTKNQPKEVISLAVNNLAVMLLMKKNKVVVSSAVVGTVPLQDKGRNHLCTVIDQLQLKIPWII